MKIMRGFELTRAKRDLYVGVLRSTRYPVRIVWGEADPALKVTVRGEQARKAAGLDTIHRLPGKHFLQEDQARPWLMKSSLPHAPITDPAAGGLMLAVLICDLLCR